LRSGATFAGYTVLRMLGSGGMGEVYLASRPRLPRHDALKVLPPTLTADIEFRQRFIREADLAATLFHPHIVGVHDRGEHEDQLWISMDYIDGTDAAQFVRDRSRNGNPRSYATCNGCVPAPRASRTCETSTGGSPYCSTATCPASTASSLA
jgi:serine/threonine-protein kinase